MSKSLERVLAEEFNALERFCRAARLPVADDAWAVIAPIFHQFRADPDRLVGGPVPRLTLKDASLGLTPGNLIAVEH